MNAVNVLCAQLTRDLFATAKFLLVLFSFKTTSYNKNTISFRRRKQQVWCVIVAMSKPPPQA